jgi:hypothetical protein
MTGDHSQQVKTNIEEADIRRRAYEIYCARCARGEPGDEASDWLKAEAELSTEYPCES